MNTYTAHVSTTINAPVSKVWEALTNPQIIKQYFFGVDVVTDWKVGSPIIYKGVWNDKPFEDKGVVVNFVPEKLLESTYWSAFSGLPDVPENYQKVTYQLEENNGVTTVSITQDNISSEESMKHSESNWKMVMGEMKKLLEK